MIYKCKMCGGDLEINGNEKTIICSFCGTNQTIPNVDEEKALQLYNRATFLLSNNEYDKASILYEKIIVEIGEQAEAFWGLCLCKYGIEYVNNPTNGKKIPTCHRTLTQSILNDKDYKKTIELSDSLSKELYKSEAKYIDNVQKKILEISNNEEPYDIFICYKETDDKGDRTLDSSLAETIYDELTNINYRVFFSRISLEDKIGYEYEPYIFSALNSAKIMIVIGTKSEYFNSPWVKNERSRFLSMIEDNKNKILIPCYKDISPYEMPEEFVNLQSQNLGKIGYLQDLKKGIQKLITKKISDDKTSIDTKILISNLYAKANTALVNKQFQEVDEFADQIIQLDSNSPLGYLLKFKVECKMYSKDLSTIFIEENVFFYGNFDKAYKLADDKLKQELDSFKNQYIADKEFDDYSKAIEIKRNAVLKEDYIEAYNIFKNLGDYRDSKKMADECKKDLNMDSEYMFLAIHVKQCIRPNMTNYEKKNLLKSFKRLKEMSNDEELEMIIKECDAAEDKSELGKLENEILVLEQEIDSFNNSVEVIELYRIYNEKKQNIEQEIFNTNSEIESKTKSVDQEKVKLRKEILDLTAKINSCNIFQGKLKKELKCKLTLLENEYNKLKINKCSDVDSLIEKINALKCNLETIYYDFNKSLSELKEQFKIINKEKKINELKLCIKKFKMPKKYSKIRNPNPITTYKDNAGYNMVFVTCGKYPQDKVTSYEIINKLNKLIPDKYNIVTLYGLEFMKYNGEYFIFKPIQWLVLSCNNVSNGNKKILVLLARHCLDYKGFLKKDNLKIVEHSNDPYEYFNKKTGKAASLYNGSDIDIFLNEEFYNIAFNDIEKKFLCNVEIDNSPETTLNTNNKFSCNNMVRKVFLLSARALSHKPFADESSKKFDSLYKNCSDINLDINFNNSSLWIDLCKSLDINPNKIDVNDKIQWKYENEAKENSEYFRLRDSEFVQFKSNAYYNSDKLGEDSICNWMLRSPTINGYGVSYVWSYEGEIVTDDSCEGDLGIDDASLVRNYGIRPGIVLCFEEALESIIVSNKDNMDF